MVKRYGQDAATEAAMRADQLLDEGDMDGCAVWRRIMRTEMEPSALPTRLEIAKTPSRGWTRRG